MKPDFEKELENLAKDKTAARRLKTIFEDLENSKRSLILLERAIENDYDAIMITDIRLDEPGPKIVYVNNGFTEITGFARYEVIGKTPRILQGPKTDQKVLERLKKRLKEGRPFFGKTINYRKDGSEFVNQWDVHPMTDDEGNLTHWISYQHDITERKRAEKVLLDTKIEFDKLRKHAASTFIDLDTTGTILSSNKSFRNLTGYREDELNGRKIWSFFPKEDHDQIKAGFDHFEKANFQNQSFRDIIFHREGFTIQIYGTTKVLNLQNQTVVRANVENVSLQKRIMKTLQKRNENYRALINKASGFSYMVTLKNERAEVEYVSDHFETITGMSKQDVLQSDGLSTFIHENDLNKVYAFLNNVKINGSGTCEYRIKNNSGGYTLTLDAAKLVDEGTVDGKIRISGVVNVVDKSV